MKKLSIPNRSEFHRSFAGNVTEYDFSTDRCVPGSHVNKIISALNFDRSLIRQNELAERRAAHE